MGKSVWHSKTLWVNVLGVAALVVQGYTGFIISPETQVAVLAIVNIILRFVTKEPIVWS